MQYADLLIKAISIKLSDKILCNFRLRNFIALYFQVFTILMTYSVTIIYI